MVGKKKIRRKPKIYQPWRRSRNVFVEDQVKNVKERNLLAEIEANFVPRADWGAMDSKEDETSDNPGPVATVVLSWTDTERTEWPEECSRAMVDKQREHMEVDGLPDIRYNFVACSDRRVYEGRGWNKRPWYPDTVKNPEVLKGGVIEIAFVDRFKESPVTDLTRALSNFLAVAMYKEQVTKDGFSVKALIDNEFVRFGDIFDDYSEFGGRRLI